MGRRRGEYQILIDILGISLRRVKFTNLMYKANLSYSTLRKYLLEMSKQGLIEAENDNGYTIYYATEKGKLILNRLREINQILHV
jgi:predicted transcriptional regulator